MKKQVYKFIKSFQNNGTVFSGMSAASRYLKIRGFSLGVLEVGNPTAVVKGKWRIPKWSLLLDEEKNAVDGIMESDDFANGTVVVKMKEAI